MHPFCFRNFNIMLSTIMAPVVGMDFMTAVPPDLPDTLESDISDSLNRQTVL
jgi:hypothetical protein